MDKEKILELKNNIDMNRIPKHIGVIMDGNGRWAKEKKLARTEGHKEGVKRVTEIVEVCFKLNVECLSLYAFSTENWKRPLDEINVLMNLLTYYIKKELKRIDNNNIKVQTMGDISKFPKAVISEIDRAIETTKNNTGMILNIGLNYGGRSEIIRAVKNILKDEKKGIIKEEDINEETFSEYLYTRNLPELDLLIRPSGELRLSNFMLYQAAYTEFYFSDIYWPDFKEEHLYKAIIDYQNRDRRFGGI